MLFRSALVDAGAIQEGARGGVEKRLAGLGDEIGRYKQEKKEILEGSEAVGPEGQVLEKDGQKGQIYGANQWEAKLAVLGESGDSFDMSTLWLQLSLVLGAVSLVIQAEKLKWTFYGAMVLCGALGSVYSVIAFNVAMSAP